MSTPSHRTDIGSSSHDEMGGMPMTSGTGLNATLNGYPLTVRATPMSGMAMPLTLTITRNGTRVTRYSPDQIKLRHRYLIRPDLTGLQHLHPTMSQDGTWTTAPATLAAGRYRVYVQCVPHAEASHGALVLSRPLTVGGAAPSAAIPVPTANTTIDGYTVTVSGTPAAGAKTPIRFTVSKDGKPVTDLQPYLQTYAHVTAIHEGDLAFAHLHPTGTVTGNHGGPTLTVNADLPEPGHYRMFIQFQTGDTLHTAALILAAS